ncbi:STAS domain-containing protein [Amycolatopsis sp. lyj-108]|uniref:STAS domain-containing protein n=1 Tax=Amycolatopsis sp. lyj-108 TaxID=2789286 RepID=UPI00397E1C55
MAGVVAHVVAGTVTFQVSDEVAPGFVDRIDHAFALAASALTSTMVVDLTEVTFLSLEGAAELVTLARHCAEIRRDLRVIPSLSVRRKLTLSGLDTHIPLADA